MKRFLWVLAASGLVWLLGTAQASHISVTGPPPQLNLGVGTLGATVDTVTFSIPSGSEGSGVPVAGSQTILIEVAVRRAGFANPFFVLLLADSSAPLTNGSFTIPLTDFSWTATAGVIPSGTYTGATNQLLLFFFVGNGVIRREDTHTFSYANTTLYPGGTYNGTVTYTAVAI